MCLLQAVLRITLKTAYSRLWKEGQIKISVKSSLIIYISKMFSSGSYMKIRSSLPEMSYTVKCKMYRRYHILITAMQQHFAAIARKTKQLLLDREY